MEKINWPLLAMLVLLMGCSNRYSENHKNQNSMKQTSSPQLDTCNKFDFEPLQKVGYSQFHFIFDGDSDRVGTSYRISWIGKNSEPCISSKKFQVQGDGTLGELASNDDAIILNQDCGPSCTYFVILPKNGQAEVVYEMPQAIDIKRNLIAFAPIEYADSVFLVVENYISRRNVKIKELSLCNAKWKGECILCCYFEGNDLFIRWQGPNSNYSKNLDIHQRKVPINL